MSPSDHRIYANKIVQDGGWHARKTNHVIRELEILSQVISTQLNQLHGGEGVLETEFKHMANHSINHACVMKS